MDAINKLTEYFTKFPGVGPRQARRMVYYLLRQKQSMTEEIAGLMTELKKHVTTCQSCFRHFVPHTPQTLCPTCKDPNRSDESLMIVEKDVDYENIERSTIYHGKYFVLGGLYVSLAKNPTEFTRFPELKKIVSERAASGALKEIIIALPVNPDGEETAMHIRELVAPITKEHEVRITMLGRGLSTGSELEYADAETIKSAFTTRN